MLVIRNEQMQPLQKFALEEFENELVEHVKEFAPKHSEVIKDEGVRERDQEDQVADNKGHPRDKGFGREGEGEQGEADDVHSVAAHGGQCGGDPRQR